MALHPITNPSLAARIDAGCGGDITSLRSAGSRGNLLAKRGIQSWIKSGKRRDPATGVLSNFFGGFREGAWGVVEATNERVALRREEAGIVVTKRVEVCGRRLAVSVAVENRSAHRSPLLQIEHFAMLAAGGRRKPATGVYLGEGLIESIWPEPFGQREVVSGPFRNGMWIGVAWPRRGTSLRLAPGGETEAFTCMVHGARMARGFNSTKFELAPGGVFEHAFEITVESAPTAEGQGKLRSIRRRRAALREVPDLAEWASGEPRFAERWSHLCLQYDRVRPDGVRRLVDGLLLPLGFNGVVLELGRGVRTRSHSELAEPWALSLAEAAGLCAFLRGRGMSVGIEFNTPGHQHESGIARAYPHFLEPHGGPGAALCLANPDARRVVGEVIGELVDDLGPDLLHLGADEAQFEGYGTAFGHCEKCRDVPASELFADYLRWLRSLAPEGMRVGCWGDMFLRSEQFGPVVSGNGSAGDVWRAIADLPHDLEIFDWHYYPADAFPSLDYFQEIGFRPWACTAFHFDGIRRFLDAAEASGVPRVLHTTWSVPSRAKLPVESILWHGYFMHHRQSPGGSEVRAAARAIARSFWRKFPDADCERS